MAELEEVLTVLRALAPEESALEGDPVGLLIAPPSTRGVRSIGVCLDASVAAVRRAVELGVDLIVSHHPLIYHPIKRIRPETDGVSASVVALVKADIGLYAMHTNWDAAPGGINDTLARELELHDTRPLGTAGPLALPRIGDLVSPMPLREFCAFVADAIGCSGSSQLRVSDVDPERAVSRVAVCGGAGAFLMDDALKAGADAYVTADIRHHEFVEASSRGIALIDAGHGATERPGMRELALILPERLAGIDVHWLE